MQIHPSYREKDVNEGNAAEPQYEKRTTDWQNTFAISRYRGSFPLLNCYYLGKEYCSLYPGLRHIEVRYIEVSNLPQSTSLCAISGSVQDHIWLSLMVLFFRHIRRPLR